MFRSLVFTAALLGIVLCSAPASLKAAPLHFEYGPEFSGSGADDFAAGQRPETDITDDGDDILSHCRKNLTNYKVPKAIEFRDELPKTNVGKILRRALREE